MSAPITIETLHAHPAWLPRVAEWFTEEWPQWYGPGGPGNVVQDLADFARSPDALPLGLLACAGGEPVGAAALKAESIPSHRHLGPWAAAGYVRPAHRGQGIGALLLAGLLREARRLGHAQVYCGTSTATRLLQRGGWQQIDQTTLDGKALAVFSHPT